MSGLAALQSLGVVGTARLAAWKGHHALLRQRDRGSGYEACTAPAERVAEDWRRGWRQHGIVAWLRRPGGGRLWLAPEDAADWCRRTVTPADLELADASTRGVFDLLGAGPQALGTPPAWRRDLYTHSEWPLGDAGSLAIVRADGSDIRTVWELSRCYHFVALARAYWTTGERRFAHAFVDHVESWIEQNPVGRGPHWASPMDAAIRAANWSLAVVLFADAAEIAPSFWPQLLGNLHATAAYVERYREWHPRYRGNHYVANLVGLTYVGALLRDTPAGVRWLRRGGRGLAREIGRQVHPDGASFEGALGYHRLVTELFTFGSMVAQANAPELWPSPAEARLVAMYEFLDSYLQPDGAAPMIGDADDGRLHWLSAEGAHRPRHHRLGLPEDRLERAAAIAPGERSRLFQSGGFAVIANGDDHAVIRCGAVGLAGAGSHDHNDQLGLEIVVAGERIVRDSGTYCYTRDLALRHAFRSSAAHSVVQVGDLEQNPIRADRPWRILQDRTRARIIDWENGADAVVFEGEHHGFADRGVVVRRRVMYDRSARSWSIVDVLDHAGIEACVWRLHVTSPAVPVAAGAGTFDVDVGGCRIAIRHPQSLTAALVDVASSDAYGERSIQPCIELRGTLQLPIEITTSLVPRQPSR